MALITTKQIDVFDTSLISKGDLIHVERSSWSEPKNGIVIYVSGQKIVFLHYPGIANVTNRQVLYASEVDDGTYKIRWSSDMVTVNEYIAEEVGSDDA